MPSRKDKFWPRRHAAYFIAEKKKKDSVWKKNHIGLTKAN
jgi:hypothetical protein